MDPNLSLLLVVAGPFLGLLGLTYGLWFRRTCQLQLLQEVVECLEGDHPELTHWLDDPSSGCCYDTVCVVVDPWFEDGLWEMLRVHLHRRGLAVVALDEDHMQVQWGGSCRQLLTQTHVNLLCFCRYHDLLVCRQPLWLSCAHAAF